MGAVKRPEKNDGGVIVAAEKKKILEVTRNRTTHGETRPSRNAEIIGIVSRKILRMCYQH